MARAKSTGSTRKSTGSRRAPQRKKASSQHTLETLFGPDHIRDLFALGLIALALVTVVFYATGTAGVIGAGWVALTRQLLGWGALLVPVSLGLLGVAILWQERREDLRLTAKMILGTLLVLFTLLMLLEFALGTRQDAADQVGAGGGLLGFTMLELFARAIGRPAAFVIVCVMALAGIMLTFDITMYELVTGMSDSFGRFWAMITSANTRGTLARPDMRPAAASRRDRDFPYEPPPESSDEIVQTPIAERPTNRKLFERPQLPQPATHIPVTPAPITAPTSTPSGVARAPETPKRSIPKPDPVLANLLATPAAVAKAAEPEPAPRQRPDRGSVREHANHRPAPVRGGRRAGGYRQRSRLGTALARNAASADHPRPHGPARRSLPNVRAQ